MGKKYVFLSLMIVMACTLGSDFSPAQWVQKSVGLYGGSVYDFAVSDSLLFAGTERGVFKSGNDGTLWSEANTGIMNYSITTLAVSGNNVYAGIYGSGVFRTVNNGGNWNAVNTGLTNLNVRCLASGGNNTFAGTSAGVFLLLANGSVWSAVNNGIPANNVYSIAVIDGSFFAATSTGVYFTSNNGTTWSQVNNGLANLNVQKLFVSGTTLYAGTASGGLFVTTNNGAVWSSINSGLPAAFNVRAVTAANGNIIVSMINATFTESRIYYSANNGASWSLASVPNEIYYALISKGTKVLAGSSQYAYSSTDNGITWNQSSAGIPNLYINGFTVSGTDIWLGTNNGLVYMTSNNGENWIKKTPLPYIASPGNPGFTAIAAKSSGIFASLAGYGIYYTSDNGTTWITRNTGLPYISHISSTSFKEYGGNLYVTLSRTGSTGGGIYKSTNDGIYWTAFALTDQYVWDYLFLNNNRIFASIGNGIKFSSDFGNTWVDVNNGLITSGAYYYNLLATGSYVFVADINGHGVFRTSDDGANWTAVNSGLSNQLINSLVAYNNYLLAGTNSGGLYLSSNYGNNWNAVNQGLFSNSRVFSNIIVQNGYFFTGLGGGAAWRRPLADLVGIVQNGSEIQSSYSLSQNYPNPFNPAARINFSIPKSGFVNIKVYDMLGREVRTLVNEMKQPGTYSVEFNAENLLSGVYFYVLEVNGFKETKKMVLLK